MGPRTWLLGQRITIEPERVTITLDLFTRVALLLLIVPGLAAMWYAVQLSSYLVFVPGVIVLLLGARTISRTPWSAPPMIQATPEGLLLGRTFIEAARIKRLMATNLKAGATTRSPGMQRWAILVIFVQGEPLRIAMGGHGYAASSKPLEELVVAMNRVMKQAA